MRIVYKYTQEVICLQNKLTPYQPDPTVNPMTLLLRRLLEKTDRVLQKDILLYNSFHQNARLS
jgi:hypothetical protein